jgi:hypothetical protein
MALKTVNVSEETKIALDAVIEVTGSTQDEIVRVALEKLCPGIISEVYKGKSGEKLTIEAAKSCLRAARAQVASLRYERDKLWASQHGITMEEMGYSEEEEE